MVCVDVRHSGSVSQDSAAADERNLVDLKWNTFRVVDRFLSMGVLRLSVFLHVKSCEWDDNCGQGECALSKNTQRKRLEVNVSWEKKFESNENSGSIENLGQGNPGEAPGAVLQHGFCQEKN